MGTPIPYRLTIEERPAYLHAKVVGERSPANALRFLREAYAACAKTGHSSVLLEMHLSGPSLSTTAIFNVILEQVPDGRKLCKIAYVATELNDPRLPHFAETVAINRGLNVRLFETVGAAEQWLAEEC